MIGKIHKAGGKSMGMGASSLVVQYSFKVKLGDFRQT